MQTREEQIQHCAETLFAKMQVVWRAEWEVRDYCLTLVSQNGPGFIRAVAGVYNLSRRTIESHAALARFFPSSERSPELSPRTHHKIRRDTKGTS